NPVAGEKVEDQAAQPGQPIALDPGIEPGQARFPETQARRRQIHGGLRWSDQFQAKTIPLWPSGSQQKYAGGQRRCSRLFGHDRQAGLALRHPPRHTHAVIAAENDATMRSLAWVVDTIAMN